MVPHLTVGLAGRQRSSFRVCGVAGLFVATGVAAAVAVGESLDVLVEAVIVLAGIATFLGLALVTKVVRGRETLVYYHHEIAVLTVAAAAAWMLGAPVLAHLDATALGLGAFLAVGRVGCAQVGCCHGRLAARRGLRYGPEHVAAGFPSHLAGVPLVPVQLIEAAAVLSLTLAGGTVVLLGAGAGSAFVVYVSGYAVLRFGLELLRGDERRRLAALTEAQWTSLALTIALTAAGAAGLVPVVDDVLTGAVGCALVALILVALADDRRGTSLVRSPAHVREIAQAVAGAPDAVVVTSQGLAVSHGATAAVEHVTLSHRSASVRRVAAEVVRRLRPSTTARTVPGEGPVVHVLLGRDA